MKKSVLAVAIAAAAFAASAASAAQVYDKDGTTLAVGGQVEFMAGNAGNTYFGNKSADATTRDRARLTLSGRTQLTSGIAAYAYTEWQADHSSTSTEAAGNDKDTNSSFKARQQYLGVDFGQFGKVQMGRYKDPFVFASSAVDVLDEVGVYGGNDERNSGHLSYMWKGFGFDAGVSYQFAVDNYATDAEGSFNVDSGFSVYAGYTSPVVVFGPISARVGYLYLNGQDKDDVYSNVSNSQKFSDYTVDGEVWKKATRTLGYRVDDLKTIDASLSWGTNGKGLYVATNYAYSKTSYDNGTASLSAEGKTPVSLDEGNGDHKVKAWETVVTYGLDNGLRFGVSYHYIKNKFTFNGVDSDGDEWSGDDSYKTKFVQLIADYNVTPNFKVWAETCIDAGSDDYASKIVNKSLDDDKDGHNSFMVGARYVF